MKLIYLFCCAFFLIACKNDPVKKMLKTQSGELTLPGAMIVDLSKVIPIGLTSKQLNARYSENAILKSYMGKKSFFGTPIPYSNKLSNYYTRAASRPGYPFFRYDYFKDTCFLMWFVDDKSTPEHLNACIDLLSHSYGNPVLTQVDQYSNEYIWYHQNCTIQFFYKNNQNSYQFTVIDSTRYNKAYQVFREIGMEPDEE
jgi:hypothetical protein